MGGDILNPAEIRSFDKLEAKVDLLIAATAEHRTTHQILDERLRVADSSINSKPKQVVIQWAIPAGVIAAALAFFETLKPVLAAMVK